MGCDGGGNTHPLIPLGALIDEAYLDLICEDRLQRRPLVNVTGRWPPSDERRKFLTSDRVWEPFVLLLREQTEWIRDCPQGSSRISRSVMIASVFAGECRFRVSTRLEEETWRMDEVVSMSS